MDMSPYLERLADDLHKLTALADEHTRDTAERLIAALEPGLRSVLIEAMSDTAARVTADLEGVVAVVRIEGRDPVLSVEQTGEVESEPIPSPATDEADARITLRLPQSLKVRSENLAADSGLSLNSWIIQALQRATAPTQSSPITTSTRRVTGWA